MECRKGCAACCIAPSVSQAIPGMPTGKAAGEACINLDIKSMQCRIWQQDNYPELCRKFNAEIDICGDSREFALETITILERNTRPASM